MAKYDFLGPQSVLQNELLQEFTSEENAVSSLTVLNNKNSISQDENEYLNSSDWLLVVISLLESNNTISDLCLKVLLKASKKHEKVRRKLIKNNIFYALKIRLREETDFWKSNLILYSALMVVLVQGNKEAQNQMKNSGCLSLVIKILGCILDEANNNKPLPIKNTELLIYAIIASNKNPNHPQNQTEIGCIIPKVLEYLESQTPSRENQQLQLVKSFWFFIKSALDKNESNQNIFLQFSGVSVLFRSIQKILADEKCNQMEDLLVKMTGTLLKMRRNKEFLYQASHFCPVMILCEVLKTCNGSVIQQTIIFLSYLTEEFPQTLEILQTKEIKKQMKKVKSTLMKNKITAELSQNLWKRLEIFDDVNESQDSYNFEESRNFFSIDGYNSQLSPELDIFKNHFCTIHDVNLERIYPDNLLIATQDQNQIPHKIKLIAEGAKLRKRQSTIKEKQLKKIIMRNFSHSKPVNRFSHNIGRIFLLFKKFLSFWWKSDSDDFTC